MAYTWYHKGINRMAMFANEEQALIRARWSGSTVKLVEVRDTGESVYQLIWTRLKPKSVLKSVRGYVYWGREWRVVGENVRQVVWPVSGRSTDWPRASCDCAWGQKGGVGCWHVQRIRLHLEKHEGIERDARDKIVAVTS